MHGATFCPPRIVFCSHDSVSCRNLPKVSGTTLFLSDTSHRYKPNSTPLIPFITYTIHIVHISHMTSPLLSIFVNTYVQPRSLPKYHPATLQKTPITPPADLGQELLFFAARVLTVHTPMLVYVSLAHSIHSLPT